MSVDGKSFSKMFRRGSSKRNQIATVMRQFVLARDIVILCLVGTGSAEKKVGQQSSAVTNQPVVANSGTAGLPQAVPRVVFPPIEFHNSRRRANELGLISWQIDHPRPPAGHHVVPSPMNLQQKGTVVDNNPQLVTSSRVLAGRVPGAAPIDRRRADALGLISWQIDHPRPPAGHHVVPSPMNLQQKRTVVDNNPQLVTRSRVLAVRDPWAAPIDACGAAAPCTGPGLQQAQELQQQHFPQKQHLFRNQRAQGLSQQLSARQGAHGLLQPFQHQGAQIPAQRVAMMQPVPAFAPSPSHMDFAFTTKVRGFQVSRVRLRLDESVGNGAQGQVFRAALLNPSGEEVKSAVVKVLMGCFGEGVEMNAQISKLEMNAQISEGGLENLCRVYGTTTLPLDVHQALQQKIGNFNVHNQVVVMEWCQGGNLHEYLKNTCRTSHPYIIAVAARHLSSALGFLHTKSLVHGDVKPDNIFVRKEGSCGKLTFVLGDFDCMRNVDSSGFGEIKPADPFFLTPEHADGLLRFSDRGEFLGVNLPHLKRHDYFALLLSILCCAHPDCVSRSLGDVLHQYFVRGLDQRYAQSSVERIEELENFVAVVPNNAIFPELKKMLLTDVPRGPGRDAFDGWCARVHQLLQNLSSSWQYSK